MRALSSTSGCSISGVSLSLLMGSRGSVSRCRMMVALSITVPLLGSLTGSRMSVYWMGSRKSSGTSPSTSSSASSCTAACATCAASPSSSWICSRAHEQAVRAVQQEAPLHVHSEVRAKVCAELKQVTTYPLQSFNAHQD
eukprot:GHRQ01022012.1.p1 GENE.GHRQ01022012.1~~GHRQ01022012.1.p1  ORF type:complete len:140 (+),score=20.97 GHRQ01022012.1:438-857(+)